LAGACARTAGPAIGWTARAGLAGAAGAVATRGARAGLIQGSPAAVRASPSPPVRRTDLLARNAVDRPPAALCGAGADHGGQGAVGELGVLGDELVPIDGVRMGLAVLIGDRLEPFGGGDARRSRDHRRVRDVEVQDGVAVGREEARVGPTPAGLDRHAVIGPP